MRHCNAFRYLMKNLLRILNVFFKIVFFKDVIMSNTRQTIASKTYSATGRVSLHVCYLMKHHYSCLFCWLFVLHQKVFLFSYFVKVKTGKALDKYATMEDKSPE